MKSDNNITASNNSSTDSLMSMDESSIIVDNNQTIRAPMEDCTGLEVALQVKQKTKVEIKVKTEVISIKLNIKTSLPIIEMFIIFKGILNAKAVPSAAFYILFTLYVLIIIGSFIGNVLVITAVVRSPSLRKVRQKIIKTCRFLGSNSNI